MPDVFSITLFLILLNHVLFPAFIALWAFLKRRPHYSEHGFPSVSIVIAAYNESKIIKAKLENIFSVEYPAEIEIIVVADGSTDDTAEQARKFPQTNLTVLHMLGRRGKSAALNRGAAIAKNSVLVFTDANTLLAQDALKYLLQPFQDASIGGVGGRKQVFKTKERASAVADRAFWNFESRLKAWESRLGSIPTADGELFAVRRELFQPLAESIINDDMELTLSIVKGGHRVVYEERAVVTEEASFTLEEDFQVKARMVYGGFQAIFRHADYLFAPWRFFSVQFLIHKGLRYLMPLLLIVLFVSSLAHPAFFLMQSVFYLCAFWGFLLYRSGKRPGLFYFPLYFVYMNCAALTGFGYFLQQKQLTVIWKKAQR